MKDNVGYKLFRTTAGNSVVIGNGNGSRWDQLNVSPPRSWRQLHRKNVQRGCDLELPGLWFYFSLTPKAASIKLQAPSVKLSNQPVQAPSDKHPSQSNKRQASSHKQQAP